MTEIATSISVLAAILAATPDGGTVTWDKLATAIRCHDRMKLYGLCSRARRVVERENGMVFENVMRVGLRRLKPNEVYRTGDGAIKAIRNRARRASRSMETVDVATLKPGEQIAHLSRAALVAVIGDAARNKNIARIETLATGSDNPSMTELLGASKRALLGKE